MSLPPFPFDVTTTIPEFLSWEMGVFSSKITEGRIYYRGRIPSLHPTSDGTNSRLALSPHTDDEDVRDLRRGIGRLYDITRLYRLIFPDPTTYPLIHHSETCLWLLKEDWYTCFVQGLMGWVPVHVEPAPRALPQRSRPGPRSGWGKIGAASPRVPQVRWTSYGLVVCVLERAACLHRERQAARSDVGFDVGLDREPQAPLDSDRGIDRLGLSSLRATRCAGDEQAAPPQ